MPKRTKEEISAEKQKKLKYTIDTDNNHMVYLF